MNLFNAQHFADCDCANCHADKNDRIHEALTASPATHDAGAVEADIGIPMTGRHAARHEAAPVVRTERRDAAIAEVVKQAKVAAEFCDLYADYIRNDVPDALLENHPDLPSIEGVVKDVRAAIARLGRSEAAISKRQEKHA